MLKRTNDRGGKVCGDFQGLKSPGPITIELKSDSKVSALF